MPNIEGRAGSAKVLQGGILCKKKSLEALVLVLALASLDFHKRTLRYAQFLTG